jgi:DNA-binding response OmpR family regulator
MRILILDDNYAYALTAKTVICSLEDHAVSIVTRPQDLLSEVEAFRPDAFVFDFQLPGSSLKDVIAGLPPESLNDNFVIVSLYADQAAKRAVMLNLCGGDAQRIILKQPDIEQCVREILNVLVARVDGESL